LLYITSNEGLLTLDNIFILCIIYFSVFIMKKVRKVPCCFVPTAGFRLNIKVLDAKQPLEQQRLIALANNKGGGYVFIGVVEWWSWHDWSEHCNRAAGTC